MLHGVVPQMRCKAWYMKFWGKSVPDLGEKTVKRPKGKWEQRGKCEEEWNLEVY